MSAVDDKHAELLRSGALDLGPPLDREIAFADGGAKRVFQHGIIYFHPRVGAAFECHGLILSRYIELGETQSGFGYPVSDEGDDPNVPLGRRSRFEAGTLNFNPVIGVTPNFENLATVPEVVVKIADGFATGVDQGMSPGLDDLAERVGLFAGHPLVEAVRAVFPELVFTRLFEGVGSAEMARFVALAQQNEPDYVPPAFDNFLVVACPERIDPQNLATVLGLWAGVVDLAYVMPRSSDSTVVASGNPFFVGQGYLGTAPHGIGAQAAWAKGADGAGTQFVDLERGWFFNHEDLPKPIPLLNGINRVPSFAHGAAVLGVLVALDNTRGIAGMVPAAQASTISFIEPGQAFGAVGLFQRIASRVAESARSLRSGDILQLEVQLEGKVAGETRSVPAETDPAIFEAIRLVVRMGIVVTESAGNGITNLDDFVNVQGKHVLDSRNAAEFQDSRAIMVGGCTSEVPHGRFAKSNFGSRIDCWAWGENIITTGNPARPTQVDAYWDNPFFGGTSGATPIISGVCLLIQQMQTLLKPRPGQTGKLRPGPLREILRRTANGTSVAGSTRVMPDMASIIANEYVH